VTGAQELCLFKSGDRAAAAPILHEAFAEDVLANALDDKAFGFRTAGQVRNPGLEFE
jgi:hypothetical protein